VAIQRFLRPQALTLVLAVGGGTALATSALGQEPAAEYPSPCDASTVTKGDIDRAHTVFLSGKDFLEESNYDKAISYFKDAYAIDCSIHAILPIIATAYERKGDKAAAIRALQEYVKRAPSAPDHDTIERRIHNLADQIAHEPPPAPSASAAPPAPSASVPAPPPSVAPPASAAPAASTPAPGVASPEPQHGASPAPWILVGVGGAAVIGGVVLYGVGISDVNSAVDACPTRSHCSSGVADQGNRGRSLEAAGGIVGGIGIAAVGGGLLWHFLTRSNDSSPAPTVSFGPGSGSVSLAGRF
jgi:hypothetical protein